MRRKSVLKLWRQIIYLYSITITVLYVLYIGTFIKDSGIADRLSSKLDVKIEVKEQQRKYDKEDQIQDEWTDLGDGIQVYSAYWEKRRLVAEAPFVRIIGIAPRWLERRQHSVRCLLWYRNKTYPVFSKFTRVQLMNEHHYKPQGAAFFKCIPPEEPNDGIPPVPYAASIEWIRTVRGNRIGPPNPVPVKLIPEYSKETDGKVTACVKPMYGPYDDLRSVAEFMAFYYIMGVTHFAIYVAGVNPNIYRFFEQVMIAEPEITMDFQTWNLWMFWDEIHDNAGIASFNDCLYRYMNRTEYLLIADFDEFLVPSYITKYKKLLPDLEEVYKKGRLHSLIFQNRFYCLERNRRQVYTSSSELNILYRTTGIKEFWWPYGLRNKYITRPSIAVQAGYHNLWEYLPRFRSAIVPEVVAYSHHFRECGPLEKMARHNQGKEWKLPKATYIEETYIAGYSQLLHNSSIIHLFHSMANISETNL